MRTLESIKEDIKALGEVDLFGTAKEVTHLPEILHDDESIKYLTSGLMDGTSWLIVCTQKRILLLDHGFLFGFKQSEMNLANINSISYQTELLFGSIEIWHGGARMLIENYDKKTVKPFVEAVNAAMTAAKGARTAPVTTTAIPAAPPQTTWFPSWSVWEPWWKKACSPRKNSMPRRRSCWACSVKCNGEAQHAGLPPKTEKEYVK